MHEYGSTPVAPYTRTHDENGNFLGGQPGVDETLTYDAFNRLVGYSGAGGSPSAQYTYDAFGRRIQTIVVDASGAVTTRYVYHGDRAIEEVDETATALVASYVYGNDIDEVLRMRRDVDGTGGAEDYFYHQDDLFNVVALTDENGDVVERYDYGDYGTPEVMDASGTPRTGTAYANPYLFQGRRYDTESSLYYFRARYLDPATGRFTSRDPLGIWADLLNLGNGYTFAGNNPWSRRDPFGLESGGNQKSWLDRLRDHWQTRQAMRRALMRAMGFIPESYIEFDSSVRESVASLLSFGLFGKSPIEQADELEPWVPGIGLATRIAQYTGDIAGIVAAGPALFRSLPGLLRGGLGLLRNVAGLGGEALRAMRGLGDDLLGITRRLLSEETGAALSSLRRGNPVSNLNPIARQGAPGENFLARTYGGRQQVGFSAGQGRRVLDNVANSVGRESKIGRVSNRLRIRRQVENDAYLLRNGILKRIEWHFFPGKTGVGPSAPLEKALRDAGIDIVIHGSF